MSRRSSSAATAVEHRHEIHFVDLDRIGSELRPVCGAWSEHVTWTTIRGLVTCLACARRTRAARRGSPHATPNPPG